MPKRKPITGIRRKKKPNTGNVKAHASHVRISETPENVLGAEGSIPAPKTSVGRLSGGNGGDGHAQYRVSKAFGRMKPRTKHISQAIIRSKWAPLPEGAQEKVESVFRSAQLPVLARYVSKQEKDEVQAALNSLIQTLSKRLPKMPFPPKIKEQHFDYAGLVRSNRQLQQQLVTSADSIVTLTEELEKQRAGLLSDNLEQEN